MIPQTVWIGYDSREVCAFAVARFSIRKHNRHVSVSGLVLNDLRRKGLYWRPTEDRINMDGRKQLWDVISGAPMSTEFSISRFLVPELERRNGNSPLGWALFVDGDVMLLDNVSRLFECSENRYAVMCVKHTHEPIELQKMDGQIQTRYSCKNWSSVMLFNCDHPSNRRLTTEIVNSRKGIDLHQFCWLDSEEIGSLPPEWNYLVGSSEATIRARLVHFTSGLPDMPGYEKQEFADEWRDMLPYAVGAL